MRTVFLFLVLFCTDKFTKLYAQLNVQDSIVESRRIVNIEQEMMDGIPAGNVAVWNKYLEKKFFIVTEDGSRLNRAEFLATIKPLPSGYTGSIKVTDPRVVFSNKIAVINYVSDEYEFVFGQKIHTTYSSMNTYINTASGWRMITSQVFEIPQLPPSVHLGNAVLEKYAGIYQLSDSINCSVVLQNDTLYMQKKGGAKQALLPETESIFFRLSDTRGRKYFSTDVNGMMLLMERRNGQDVVWKRLK